MAKEKMSINTRFEYLRRMQDRYRLASRKEKSRLLDDMEAVTHLGRKHLIALMNRADLRRRKRSRERERIYDAELIRALTKVADTLDWICAERLHPALRPMAQCLIDWGEMEVSAIVLDKLDQISIATVGRILKGIRPTERLPRAYPGRRSENRAQQAVPISVIHWDEPEPGYFEVDLVQHGAPGQGDKLIHTVQFIDVLTGWSERIAIMGTGFEAVWQAIQTFKGHCPIPVREIHSDNGSEFINLPLIAAFGQELGDATQTRGQPGYHHDNRFVEQKNSSLVRAYVGYVHLDTYEQLRALNALYEKMWLYYNFFQPVLRQIERTAATGPDGIIRIRRKQDRARTPLERLIEAEPPISRETRERLLDLRRQTNPLALKRSIHAQLRALFALATESRKEKANPV